MLVRREAAADGDAVRWVTEAAFGRPEEARLVTELRAGDAWLPALSFVAVDGDAVIGHVVCTRARVGAWAVLALGPLSVHPGHQRRGAGQALTHTVLGAADALGEPLVGLLGSPAYYARFGFRPAGEYEIVPPVPEWRDDFQVRPLTAYAPAIRGPFTYPEPFDRV
jgi:putative acetyltransferase